MSAEDFDDSGYGVLDGIGWEEFRRRSSQGLPYPSRADVPVRPAREVLPTRPVVVREKEGDVLDGEMVAELARTRAVAEKMLAYARQSGTEWVTRNELVRELSQFRGYRVSAAALWLEEHGYIEIQRYTKAGKNTFRVRLL